MAAILCVEKKRKRTNNGIHQLTNSRIDIYRMIIEVVAI